MPNLNAREIVKAGEAAGLSHAEMAKICNVSVGTVSRWKKVNKARANVISLLEESLESIESSVSKRIYLNEASLEELAERARQLGFRCTFTDINT